MLVLKAIWVLLLPCACAFLIAGNGMSPVTVRGLRCMVHLRGESAFVACKPRSVVRSNQRMAADEFDFDAFEAEVKNREGKKSEEQPVSQDGSSSMDAAELRSLVVEKWGRPFDTKIHRRRDGFGVIKYYLQVMWKHVEQQSFHMTEEEYMEQLEAVASLVSEWGLAEYVREEIKTTTQKPGIQVGGGPISGAVAVSIPLATEDDEGQIVPGRPGSND